MTDPFWYYYAMQYAYCDLQMLDIYNLFFVTDQTLLK
jgi:hypothetical protein